jgi:hypothetical protein
MAYGVSDGQQVGGGRLPGNVNHALLWMGSADSVVDLHPSGFTDSVVYGVFDGQQVGYGQTGNLRHALLWTGSADSVVDLHPSGFDNSVAVGVSGGQQVGYGQTGDLRHALLWTGSADSVLDLHTFLTPESSDSTALGIDVDGNIVGYVRDAFDRVHAYLLIPE